MSGIFQNIDPPPLSTQRLCPPPHQTGYILVGQWGGGGSIFWKTPDIGLASYSLIPLRCKQKPAQELHFDNRFLKRKTIRLETFLHIYNKQKHCSASKNYGFEVNLFETTTTFKTILSWRFGVLHPTRVNGLVLINASAASGTQSFFEKMVGLKVLPNTCTVY